MAAVNEDTTIVTVSRDRDAPDPTLTWCESNPATTHMPLNIHECLYFMMIKSLLKAADAGFTHLIFPGCWL